MHAHGLNRRAFLTGLGCAAMAAGLPKLPADGRFFGVRRVREYAGVGIILPAVAAACMPETLVIADLASGVPMRGTPDFEKSLGQAGYVEFRKYVFDRAEILGRMEQTFTSFGIRPLLTGPDGIFLLCFATLASREKAWRELSAEPAWRELQAQLEELAIYKVPEDLHSVS